MRMTGVIVRLVGVRRVVGTDAGATATARVGQGRADRSVVVRAAAVIVVGAVAAGGGLVVDEKGADIL